jgi:SH3-like domain-containing protein
VRFSSRHRLLLAALALLTATSSRAAEEKLPHFASLRVDEVNLRAGPGERYPVEWVFERKGWPVEVLAQFDVWRKVRDSDGTEGWVHQRMLTAARSVVVEGGTRTLRAVPEATATAVAKAEPGVIARLIECRAAWCRVEAQGLKGWLQRSEIWGVFPNETVE